MAANQKFHAVHVSGDVRETRFQGVPDLVTRGHGAVIAM